MKLLAMMLACGSLIGCAKYEFELIQPPDLARHIGYQAEETVTRGPLEYWMRAYENRLVMKLYNHAQQPIELLGPQCAVVDPGGQSHPLLSQTIAPGSFVKLIFPPLRPEIYPTGPSIQFGVGTQVGCAGGGPLYLGNYGVDSLFWTWDGQTDVRVFLVFKNGDEILQHEFVFRKIKM